MKTYRAYNGTTFTYSSDLSGKVIIVTPNHNRIEVEGKDLIEFLGAVSIENRIHRLEQIDPIMFGKTLLGV